MCEDHVKLDLLEAALKKTEFSHPERNEACKGWATFISIQRKAKYVIDHGAKWIKDNSQIESDFIAEVAEQMGKANEVCRVMNIGY